MASWLDFLTLQRKHPDIFFDFWSKNSYYNPETKEIVIGTRWRKFSMNDFEGLIQHEKAHKERNISIHNTIDNIIEDIVINSDIPQTVRINQKIAEEEKEDLIKKVWLTKDEIKEKIRNIDDLKYLTTILNFKGKEREEIFNTLKERNVIVESKELKEFEEEFERQKEEKDNFSNCEDFFTKDFQDRMKNNDSQISGDGTTNSPRKLWDVDYCTSYSSNEIKALKDILKKLITPVNEEIRTKSQTGKRISREFLEKRLLSELNPLEARKEVITDNKPNKLLVLVDCSGSMRYTPEKLSKEFIVALKETGDFTFDILFKNEYEEILKSSDEISSEWISHIHSHDDEGFDDFKVNLNRYNKLVLFTDFDISNSEEEGLLKAVKKIPLKYAISFSFKPESWNYPYFICNGVSDFVKAIERMIHIFKK